MQMELNKREDLDQAVKRLDEIIELLKQNDIDEEEALRLSSEGVELIRDCSASLDLLES